MKKKFNGYNLIGLLGVVLLLIGVSSVVYDIASKAIDKQNIEKEKEDFLNSIGTGETEGTPGEGSLDELYGILTIDKIGIDNPITISGNYDLLYRYLVAYEKSTLPPNQGNFVIVGHNGKCANCGFRNLYRLESGDIIEFKDKTNTTYKYEVYNVFVVDKSDVYVMDDIEGETTLTLITCQYPSLTRPERLIVRARLIQE